METYDMGILAGQLVGAWGIGFAAGYLLAAFRRGVEQIV